MTLFSFLYPGGIVNCPRNYILGVALPPVVFNVDIVAGVLVFNQPLALNAWSLTFNPNFLDASSNVYSSDFIFDAPNCHFYHNGVETFNQLNLFIGYAPGERELRVCIATEFGFEPANYFDFPIPDVPWPPRDL